MTKWGLGIRRSLVTRAFGIRTAAAASWRCAVSGVVTVVGNYDCLEGRSLNLGPGIDSVLIITQSVLGGS